MRILEDRELCIIVTLMIETRYVYFILLRQYVSRFYSLSNSAVEKKESSRLGNRQVRRRSLGISRILLPRTVTFQYKSPRWPSLFNPDQHLRSLRVWAAVARVFPPPPSRLRRLNINRSLSRDDGIVVCTYVRAMFSSSYALSLSAAALYLNFRGRACGTQPATARQAY